MYIVSSLIPHHASILLNQLNSSLVPFPSVILYSPVQMFQSSIWLIEDVRFVAKHRTVIIQER